MGRHDQDPALEQALADEGRDLLRRIGDDPGHVDQVLSLFSGRTAWVSGVLLATHAVMFAGGVWTGWRFFEAETALAAVDWGLPSAVLLTMSLMLKLALWPVMQTNRLWLDLKRMELLISRAAAG